MKVLTEQRVIWSGDYFGIDIKVYVNEHVNYTGAAFLATDKDGELILHLDEPLFEGDVWEGWDTGDNLSIAQFEDVEEDFPANSLMEIQCS